MRALLFLSVLLIGCQNTAQEPAPDISLKVRNEDSVLVVKGINNTYAFIDLRVTMEDSDSLVDRLVIPPLDSVVIAELGKGDRVELVNEYNQAHDINYFLGGDPNTVKHDDSYLYLLPYQKGKKYSVSQGANGSFSHNNDISRYAIDFSMKVGEPVHAARGGIVVKTIEHFKKSGGRELLWKANRIIILHEDGTTASYVHLKYEGSLVEPGDTVERGQLIGYSGNTGFTRGPHLHFVVRREDDLAVPVYFEGYAGKQLQKGKRYYRK